MNSGQQQDDYRPHARGEETRTRRQSQRSRRKAKYVESDQQLNIQQEHFEDQQEQIEAEVSYQFLKPKVEALLWRRERQNGESQYLVKWKFRSYHQVSWLSKEELKQKADYEASSGIKSMQRRVRKTKELKLDSQHYFNPAYLIPDRILDSSDIFTAIHHKRANDIKGKWDETILTVTQKLLNFRKNGYPYGIQMHEPYNEDLQKEHKIEQPIYLGQIINKVFLGYYKNSQVYWQELGMAINNYLMIYPEEKGDFHVVGQTIKEAAVFLHIQWHRLCKQRYEKFKGSNDKKDEQGMVAEETELSEKEKEGMTVDVVSQFCEENIFLTQKIADTPNTPQELQLHNPGTFSLKWLTNNPDYYTSYKYSYLSLQDLRSLDLNCEVDKLYFVKWRDLSYSQASWESEQTFNCPEKVEEFKIINKIPVKEIRKAFDVNNMIHKFLPQYNDFLGEKRPPATNGNIKNMETKFYRLDVGKDAEGKVVQPRQYGDKDIPIFKNYRQLKPFQLESLNWLINSWYQNRNCILADEMGLGKTIQTIAFLYHLNTYQGMIGPFLILAPLTTLPQWRREIEEWTSFKCLLYYDQGRSQARQLIQHYEFNHLHVTKNGDVIASKMPKFQIFLTNYELFMSDFDVIVKLPFQHLVLDQAHRLKNKYAKLTNTLARLPCPRKTLLTGTPIQNNTRQLWTLLHYIEPKHFQSEQDFLRKYGNLNTEEHVKQFKKMLKPYLLRRVKQDVESSIPKLSETIIDVEMSTCQKAYYRGVLQKNKTAMLKGLSSANFNAVSLQLRKCCNHPFLIAAAVEDQIKYGAKTAEEETQRFIGASGKTILLLKLLSKFKKQGKKALIFSQFVTMLQLLKPYLELKGYNCELLTGAVSSVERHQAINRFNKQADLFLISTKAGGVGINLTSATQIIIYDSDWNPQNDIQATARAHRIGQKHAVSVYRMIIANSYESEMFQMASKKLGLDKAIFTGDTFKSMGEFDDAEKQLTKAEIEMLLKKGIVGFLDNQQNEEQYFNQSIEDILSKNARKVEYSMPQSSTTFSKTKFKSNDPNNIEIDAPDFWQRALKVIDTPIDQLIKKRQHLKEYDTLEKQQQLMLETYHIVVDFVKHKNQGTGFNAEDERNLKRLLEDIYSQRHIDRHLRDVADELNNQLEKPSRRFKLKPEDIIQNVPAPKVEPQGQKTTRTRLTRQSELAKMGLQSPQSELNSAIQDSSSPSSDQSKKQKKKSQKKEQRQDQMQPEYTGKEEHEQKEQENIEELFSKLCSLCERPRCTVRCAGFCQRSFHKKCFDIFNSGSNRPPQSPDLVEYRMDMATWKVSRENEQECCQCSNKKYRFNCSVCFKEGKLDEASLSTSISNESQQSHKATESSLYKCTRKDCSRFYHLKCLFTPQFAGKFSQQNRKTIMDVSQPNKAFICPAHYCQACHHNAVRSYRRSTCCIRCCVSFHPACCDPELFKKIGKFHYICSRHLKYPGELDFIKDEINNFKKLKSDMKKKKKQTEEDSSFSSGLSKVEVKSELKADKEQANVLRRSKRKKQFEKVIHDAKTDKQKKEEEEELLDVANSLSMIPEKTEQNEQQQYQQKQQKDIGQQKLTKADKLTLQYPDFGLTPPQQLDFTVYTLPWCSYCGARYATEFKTGPWKGSHLCPRHFQKWEDGNLKLQKHKSRPRKPMRKGRSRELFFLNEYATTHNLSGPDTVKELKKKLENQ